MRFIAAILVLFGLASAPALAADEVGITKDLMEFQVETDGGPVTIKRIQDQAHEITGYYAQTSRKCPPFCVQPMQAAPGVTTIGELELIEMLRDPKTKVIDARTLDWHLKETIPGSVHIPYTEVATRLDELGCTRDGEKWNCDGAEPVALYCNGIWCGQSPTAIRAMLREGYPADKLFYYRGGMQAWKVLGFNTVEGSF